VVGMGSVYTEPSKEKQYELKKCSYPQSFSALKGLELKQFHKTERPCGIPVDQGPSVHKSRFLCLDWPLWILAVTRFFVSHFSFALLNTMINPLTIDLHEHTSATFPSKFNPSSIAPLVMIAAAPLGQEDT